MHFVSFFSLRQEPGQASGADQLPSPVLPSLATRLPLPWPGLAWWWAGGRHNAGTGCMPCSCAWAAHRTRVERCRGAVAGQRGRRRVAGAGKLRGHDLVLREGGQAAMRGGHGWGGARVQAASRWHAQRAQAQVCRQQAQPLACGGGRGRWARPSRPHLVDQLPGGVGAADDADVCARQRAPAARALQPPRRLLQGAGRAGALAPSFQAGGAGSWRWAVELNSSGSSTSSPASGAPAWCRARCRRCRSRGAQSPPAPPARRSRSAGIGGNGGGWEGGRGGRLKPGARRFLWRFQGGRRGALPRTPGPAPDPCTSAPAAASRLLRHTTRAACQPTRMSSRRSAPPEASSGMRSSKEPKVTTSQSR